MSLQNTLRKIDTKWFFIALVAMMILLVVMVGLLASQGVIELAVPSSGTHLFNFDTLLAGPVGGQSGGG